MTFAFSLAAVRAIVARGAMKRMLLRGLAGMALCWGIVAQASAQAPAPASDAVHLGVASCAGSTCHGAVTPLKGSTVAQNEYITWSRKDKHAKAYEVLGEERGERIARNLGLGDARTAQICLDCHADNVPPADRGPEFQISDGVGCEACHGGAKSWLGVHISGATHAENIAAGLYPTDQPVARAEKCLSCHMGDEKRFVTHLIMGAGHPRMGFELDTYTMAEPAHFVINKTYIDRKGPVNDVRVWAVGQAVALEKFMDNVLDPKHAPKGLFPELVLFDCTACHHGMDELRWQERPAAQLPPGLPPLNDSYAIMLRVIAARVAPDQAKPLADHILALHRASTESWPAVVREARAVRDIASALVPVIDRHEFGPDDMRALADGVIAAGLSRDAADYPGAEQATMALASIVSELRLSGDASAAQTTAMNQALDGLYESLATNETYKPDAFLSALRDFQKTLAMR
jgi:Cytochrome c554 and c-prime